MTTRRSFLITGAAAGVGASLRGTELLAADRSNRDAAAEFVDDEALTKEIVQRGCDEALSNGANYAEVRLSMSNDLVCKATDLDGASSEYSLRYNKFIGVRVNVQGITGFSAGPVWSTSDVVGLAREAVRQAKTNSWSQPMSPVEPPSEVSQSGDWKTPMKIDPFTVHPDDMINELSGLNRYVTSATQWWGVGHARRIAASWGGIGGPSLRYKQLKTVFGNSSNRYGSQTITTFNPETLIRVSSSEGGRSSGFGAVPLFPETGGWELFNSERVRNSILKEVDRVAQLMLLPSEPLLGSGRYKVVMSSRVVADLLYQTIATAAEMDTVLGYEANATGSSYLSDLKDVFGNYRIGSPLLDVTVNRNEAGGLATVGWDDEGVAPQSLTLVKGGVFQDGITSCQAASWVQNDLGRSYQSAGYAVADSAWNIPLIRVGNINMAPGRQTMTKDDMVLDVKNGFLIDNAAVSVDMQKMSGVLSGMVCYVIRNGKVGAQVDGSFFALFTTSEIWKRLVAVGDASSLGRHVVSSEKGQPSQMNATSVTAPPCVFEDLSFVASVK